MSIIIGVLALSLIGADLPAPQVSPPRTSSAETVELWPLSLAHAITIGLDNSERVRVITSPGSPLQCGDPPAPGDPCPTVIAPVERSMSPWQFQAEAMAEVRTIEQAYWELSRQHTQHGAREKELERTRAVLKREQAELQVGRGTVADIAEAEQRVEQLSLGFVASSAEVLAAERRLRHVLGLPPADNRRIIPVTIPNRTLVKPDWEQCLATMQRRQPDVALRRESVDRLERRIADVSLTLEDQTSDALAALGLDSSRVLRATTAALLAGPRASLKTALHQTTHALARSFLKLDATSQQFHTATRSRAAAAQRLEAQRVFYEEGRIPIDRYLDALNRYTEAVAQEAEAQSAYSGRIAALEEAKGTLLDARGIQIAPLPRHIKPYPHPSHSD